MTAYELGGKAFAEYVARRGDAFNTPDYWAMIHFMAKDIIELGDFETAQEVMEMDAHESEAFRAALGLIPTTA